jgi:hypothetical protein
MIDPEDWTPETDEDDEWSESGNFPTRWYLD